MKLNEFVTKCHVMREVLMKEKLSQDDIDELSYFCLEASKVAQEFSSFKHLIIKKQQLEEEINGKCKL